MPVTIIASDEATIAGSWLAAEFSKLKVDDVFSDDFHSHIIFCCRSPVMAAQPLQLDQAAEELLEKMSNLRREFVGARSWNSGPYFSLNGNIYEAWKLYPDNAEAFYFSTVPDPGDPNQ